MTYRNILAGSIVAAICLSAGAANATADPPQLRVKYNVWELRTQAGAQGVYSRIKRGAERACPDGGVMPISDRMAAVRCQEELIELAVAKLGSPIVTALHSGNESIQLASRK
jgi:UrcA family protein